jgi:predicted GH43/DUF377 family glycosyl hydrolase
MAVLIVMALALAGVTVYLIVSCRPSSSKLSDSTHRILMPVHQLRQPVRLQASYRAFNPSLTRLNGQLLLGARVGTASNCQMDVDSKTLPKSSSQRSATNLFFVGPLDTHKWRWAHPPSSLLLPSEKIRRMYSVPGKQEGVEDIRMHSLSDGTLLLVGTVVRKVGIGTSNQMYTARVSPDMQLLSEQLLSPNFTSRQKRQKNWTPFVYDGNVLYVYSVHPHVIVRVVEGDKHKLDASVEKLYSTTSDTESGDRLRGGTNVVQFGDQYLVCAHLSVGGVYRSVFYTFSAVPPFQMLALGNAVVFGAPGSNPNIQYPAGLAYDKEKGRLLVAYGENDCHMVIAEVPAQETLNSLHPVHSAEVAADPPAVK